MVGADRRCDQAGVKNYERLFESHSCPLDGLRLFRRAFGSKRKISRPRSALLAKRPLASVPDSYAYSASYGYAYADSDAVTNAYAGSNSKSDS